MSQLYHKEGTGFESRQVFYEPRVPFVISPSSYLTVDLTLGFYPLTFLNKKIELVPFRYESSMKGGGRKVVGMLGQFCWWKLL